MTDSALGGKLASKLWAGCRRRPEDKGRPMPGKIPPPSGRRRNLPRPGDRRGARAPSGEAPAAGTPPPPDAPPPPPDVPPPPGELPPPPGDLPPPPEDLPPPPPEVTPQAGDLPPPPEDLPPPPGDLPPARAGAPANGFPPAPAHVPPPPEEVAPAEVAQEAGDLPPPPDDLPPPPGDFGEPGEPPGGPAEELGRGDSVPPARPPGLEGVAVEEDGLPIHTGDIEIEEIAEPEELIEPVEELAEEAGGPPPPPTAGGIRPRGVCDTCGGDPIWKPENQRWYCPSCRKFL